MSGRSTEVFQSLILSIAAAGLAHREGKTGERDALIEHVQALIKENGLQGHVGIQEIHYNGTSVFRLGGPVQGELRISYIIRPRGVEFE